MEYKCENDKCSNKDVVVDVAKTITGIVNGELVEKGSECSECGEYMTFIPSGGGFGNPFKAEGDRGRNYYGG